MSGRIARAAGLAALMLACGVSMVAVGPRIASGADEPYGADVAATAGAGTPASGAEAPRASWAYDLAGDLMSPFCPGRTLASCPSPQAGELIQWIATQEAAGVSRDEVIRMLVDRYGEDVLGAPPAKGITLWAYVLPVLGFVAFGAVALLVLRRIVSPAARATDADPSTVAGPSPRSPADGTPPGVSADLARIVDAELDRRA